MFTVTLNFVFKAKWKCVKYWAYLCKILYFLNPNANEMFQKKLRLLSMAVEVLGGKVGYCSSHSGCNRVRVGVGDWGERQ